MSYGNAPLDPYYNRTDRPPAGGGGGVAGVSAVAAGDGISVAPLAGTGNVTITNLRNNLSELEDVRAANPAADQVLQYDNTTGFWEAKTLTTPPPPDIMLGGQRTTLTSFQQSTLLDVEMPGPPVVQLTRGNYLAWDPTAGGPMPNPAEGPRGAWNPQLPRLSNNVDVVLSSNPPPTGHVLQFTGTTWENTTAPLATHSLNDHLDVSHTATGGEMLHLSTTSNEWAHTPRIRVDEANGGDVLITTVGTGLLSVASPAGNVLQTGVGNFVEMGSTARQSNIRGTEVYVGVPAGSATNLIRQDGKAVATYAADARADVSGNPIPNMRAVRDEIAATAPTSHTLESHSNVQDITTGGQVLVKNNVTDEWQGTGRITVDSANSDNVTVGLLAGGILTVNTPSTNILSTNTGGSVSLGDSARACDVLGDDVTLNASVGIFLTAPDGISLTTTNGAISVSALSESVLLGVGTGATDVVRITEDATTYATKIGSIAQAVPNVEFVNNQIALLAPVPALDDLTDVNAPTPNNFDVLTYDDGTNTWIAAPPAPSTGVQWGLGGNAEGVFPGQDAIIDNTTGRLVLAQGGVEFLQARTSWNVILGDVANFDAQSPPNFPVSLYGSGIRSTGLGDTTFDVTADYGTIAFSHVNMANSTPISFNVGNGAGAVLQYNVLGAGRDDAATMAAKIEAIPQAIPNMECITRAIAALPPPPTVPTVLNDLTDVETVNPNNQFLWFNSTTSLWEGSPRITVDPFVNENVRINMVGVGTFQLDDAIAGNLLSSVVGGAITLGASARDVIINALESTHTSQGNATFTAGGSIGLTSGNVVNITTGTANPSDLILQLGKTAVDYATDCTGVDNAIPNVRYIDQAINGLSSVYVVNGNNAGGVNVSTGGNQNINFSCVGGVGTQQQIIMTPSVNPLSYVQIGTAFKTPEDYRDHVLALGTGDRDSAVPNVALVDSRIGTVAPAAHTHPQSEVDGLVNDLLFLNNTKATKGGDITAPGLGVYALGTTDNNSEVQLLRNNAPFIRSTTTNFVAGTNTLPSIYQGDSINILSNNEAIELTSLAKDVSVVVGNASTSLAKISTTYKTTAGYASQIRAFADGSCIPNRQFVDEATDRHRCGGAFQGNTTPTTISVAGNVAAIAGTVTSYTSGFTVSGTTFFQYNGADTAVFFVNYTATPAITSVDRTAVFTCWLSPSGPVNPTGSPILGSRSRVITRGALTHTGTASASFYVSMTSGQSLRFYVSNTDAANDIIVEDFSMTALRVSQLLV